MLSIALMALRTRLRRLPYGSLALKWSPLVWTRMARTLIQAVGQQHPNACVSWCVSAAPTSALHWMGMQTALLSVMKRAKLLMGTRLWVSLRNPGKSLRCLRGQVLSRRLCQTLVLSVTCRVSALNWRGPRWATAMWSSICVHTVSMSVENNPAILCCLISRPQVTA